MIFVFGSNEAGVHGAGAAAYARMNRGAKYGVGRGLCGQSYAIPTKNRNINTRSLDEIAVDVDVFKRFAADHPDQVFQVTAIGCGLAGYQPESIAPMFADAPENCLMPPEWAHVACMEGRACWND